MNKAWVLFLLLSFSTLGASQTIPPVSTFSIVAYDPSNGDLGVGVASHYFSVGSVVPWAMAGVGAVATQANVNAGYGQEALDLLRTGLTAPEVLKKILADDKLEGRYGRQVTIVDAKGNFASYTGPNAPRWAGSRRRGNWSVQGNSLAGAQVADAMGEAFENAKGELADKLFAALKAGDVAGGDARGRQSASILVVRKDGGRNINNDRYIYINVDDSPDPLAELHRLLDLNLAYNYMDQMYKTLRVKPVDGKKAEAAGMKAVSHAESDYGVHLNVAFVHYLAGDKQASLDEFAKARALNLALFNNDWKVEVNSELFKSMAADNEFLGKLFPDGVPK